MSIKERILAYADVKKLTKAQIEKLSGLGRNSFNNSKSMNSDALATFLANCPDLSAEWLMRGEGNMFRGNTPYNVNNFDMSTIKDNGIKIGDNNNNVSVGNSKDETIQKILEMQQQLLNYLTTDKV